jgi:hypothetical protein
MVSGTTEVSVCFHCGNTVPLILVATHSGKELFEEIDRRRFFEAYEVSIYRCPTCEGLSLFGDYSQYPRTGTFAEKRLYPRGSMLLPAKHLLGDPNCVPKRTLTEYEQIWPLRFLAPTAFAISIRRLLEGICIGQQAQGNTLFSQLKDLVARGTFPGNFAEITDLVRQVGNLGAHSAAADIDVWDAELLDDFFRSIIEYVYIVPSKIARLKQRISFKNSP